MARPVIEAEGLGIKFTRNRRQKKRVSEMLARSSRQRSTGEFWPLRDVSFTVQPGDALGVIGANGTGKSTLLKLIAGVLLPDEGAVTVHGSTALLELRAGMNGDLTGRDNVYLMAALHGLPASRVSDAYEHIVDFAGIKDFMDTPVRHYSTGMKVRLGFAVAAQLHDDILLADEVLAVGDKAFRRKCYTTIESMLAEGRSLVLVSHNEKDLTRFCTRGLYLTGGALKVDGSVGEALEAYNADGEAPEQ